MRTSLLSVLQVAWCALCFGASCGSGSTDTTQLADGAGVDGLPEDSTSTESDGDANKPPSGADACVSDGSIVIEEGTSVAAGSILHLSLVRASGGTSEFFRVHWTVDGPGEPVFVPANSYPTPTLTVDAPGEYRLTATASAGDAGIAFSTCKAHEASVTVQ